MKKVALICLALILALSSMGFVYARWYDTVTINGTVATGEVCVSIEEGTYGEVACTNGNDKNWTDWVPVPGNESCPPGYGFTGIHCESKDVGWITFGEPILDAEGNIVELPVVIHNAYPYFLGHISIEFCNCGSIPIHIEAPVFQQDDGLVIEYRNGTTLQLHRNQCHEISFFVGVTQYLSDGVTLTPQGAELHFSIGISGIQWAE